MVTPEHEPLIRARLERNGATLTSYGSTIHFTCRCGTSVKRAKGDVMAVINNGNGALLCKKCSRAHLKKRATPLLVRGRSSTRDAT